MAFVSSIPPARRAGLRRLRADFEAAFEALDDPADRSSPAYRAADARYRAWIKAMDAVAVALLDDIDACEAAGDPAGRAPCAGAAPGRTGPADVAGLFSGVDEARSAVELIGAAAAPAAEPRRSTPTSRAMGIVGADRAARLRGVGPRHDGRAPPFGECPAL